MVLIIQVHVMELFAQPNVLDSPAGRVSLFFGGPPVAPVFMLVMGYYIAASQRDTATLLLRGLKLIAVGGLLNLGLNAHLLVKIVQHAVAVDPWPYLLGVDILLLAGASTILLTMLRPALQRSAIAAIAVAFLVMLLSPQVTDSLTTASSARWMFAYVGGGYAWSYFPWFPWLAYPLLGFAGYRFEKERLPCGGNEKWGRFQLISRPIPMWARRVFGWGIVLACAVGAAATWQYAMTICHDLPRYYHHDIRFFLWTCAFLVVWVRLHQVCEVSWGSSLPLRWLKGLGQNVTFCYVVQWLLIGNIATALYKGESLVQWGLWTVAIVVATSLLSALWSQWCPGSSRSGGGEN